MKATQLLHNLGQSLWLDNITRDLLEQRHAQALHRRAVGDGADFESDDLRSRHQKQQRLRRCDPRKARRRESRARRCSSSWRWRISRRPPICFDPSTTGPTASTGGCRWRCRPCWPTTRPALSPRPRVCTPGRAVPNLLIKIPGTKEGLPAIEEAIFAGMPINVTLLFSREQYVAAAEAFCAASSGASMPGSSPMSVP